MGDCVQSDSGRMDRQQRDRHLHAVRRRWREAGPGRAHSTDRQRGADGDRVQRRQRFHGDGPRGNCGGTVHLRDRRWNDRRLGAWHRPGEPCCRNRSRNEHGRRDFQRAWRSRATATTISSMPPTSTTTRSRSSTDLQTGDAPRVLHRPAPAAALRAVQHPEHPRQSLRDVRQAG